MLFRSLHGPQESQVGTYAETGSSGVRNRSEFNMVSNNIFGRSGPWTVSIGPEGATYDERITDLIFEKNKVIADYGIQSIGSSLVQVGTMAEGRYMSLRNNIFDGTGGTTGYIGLYISRRGVEPPPDYCSVYNNTIYRSETATTASGNIGVKIGSSATNTLVRNNYASFPNITGTVEVVVDDSGVSTMSDNVYTRTPYFIAPDNVDPLQRDFHTTQVTGTGYTVPLLDDFDGKSRIADDTYDIGAYEY